MENYYKTYLGILNEELLTAMGCTEPIAVAYCSALAKKTLGVLPDRLIVEVSGNIVKNVKSVIVPNTDGMRGIRVAAAIGAFAGNSDKVLEVIADVTPEEIEGFKEYLNKVDISVDLVKSHLKFDIIVTAFSGDSYAKVRIALNHTNIVLIEKNGEVQKSIDTPDEETLENDPRETLNLKNILDFANHVELSDVIPLLKKQIDCNVAIAEEGIRNSYGANIGSTLLASRKTSDPDQMLKIRAMAMAAAGSDARMSGCEMPVVINSGSGNQGITVSVPIAVYAKELHVSDEVMYRSLILANLIAIYQRAPIGTLSAYCGAINAGIAAACGIAYMKGGDYDTIAHTLVNALAIISGTVCDGAKPSCAGKIAMAVDCGLLGYEMYMNGQQFCAGDGIVKKGVEAMIQSVGRLGRIGMFETDQEILKIMLED